MAAAELDHAADLSPLGGVRAVCALSIVVGHLLTFFMPRVPEDALPPYVPYICAVTIFFVVSGFILTLLYAPAPPSDFMVRRLARVAPVYWFGVAIAAPLVIMYNLSLLQTAAGAPVSLLFLTSAIGIVGAAYDGPLWQVSAFVLLYAMFPRWVNWLAGQETSRLRSVALTCWLAPAAVQVLLSFTFGGAAAPLGHILVWVRFPHFVAGMVAAEQLRRGQWGTDALFCRWSEPALTASMVLVWLAMFVSSFFADSFDAYLFVEMLLEFALLPLFVAWVVALTTKPSRLSRAVFNSAPLEFLGRLSYAIYCVHFPLIRAYSVAVNGWRLVKSDVKREHIEGMYALPLWHLPIVVLLVVGLAWLIHVMLEAHARRWALSKWASGSRGGERQPLIKV